MLDGVVYLMFEALAKRYYVVPVWKIWLRQSQPIISVLLSRFKLSVDGNLII